MSENPPSPRLSLHQVSVRLHGSLFFRDLNWTLRTGEHWAVIGTNGAGKSALVSLLCDALKPSSGKIQHHWSGKRQHGLGVVSFERQRALCESDARHDISEFMENASDPGTTVDAFLSATGASKERIERRVQQLQIDHLRSRGLRVISSGEMRRTLFAETLLRAPELLILDNLYEGIDAHSRETCKALVDDQLRQGHVLFLCRRPEELPDGITHVMVLERGRMVAAGERIETLSRTDVSSALRTARVGFDRQPVPGREQQRLETPTGPLIELRDIHADYGDTRVLDRLSLKVMPGAHLHIAGPNGSGKSTLLSLIYGDNPRAYGQQITLFGRKRGSGESVWDIKRRFGIVSNQIHLEYPKRTRAFDVIVSGLFDTLGLYDRCSPTDTKKVSEWLVMLGLADQANTRFDTLSFGEQRLLLIARAMIKLPAVMILDEPCSGLDAANRERVLALVDHIADTTQTTIIYVSHEQAETPCCIKRRVEFHRTSDSGPYILKAVD